MNLSPSLFRLNMIQLCFWRGWGGKKKTSREIKPHPPNSGRQYKCLRLSGGLCLSRWPPQLQQLSPLSLSNFTENSHHLNSDTDLCIYSHIDTFKLSGKSLKQPQKETEGNNPDTAHFTEFQEAVVASDTATVASISLFSAIKSSNYLKIKKQTPSNMTFWV